MEDALAMTILGLKSAGDAFVKKLFSTACSIPKRTLQILFGIQLKLMYVQLGCLVQIYRVVINTAIFKYIFPEKISSPEPVADQQAVVKGAKKVRRSLCLSLEQYYGLDLKSDMDLIQARLDEVHRCMDMDDDDKTFEALAKLRELNKPFEDESWRDKYITDLEVIEYTDDESETVEKPTNMLQKPESDKIKVSTNAKNLNSNEIKKVKQVNNEIKKVKQVNNEIKVKQVNNAHQQVPARNNQAKGALKNKLTLTNAKLEEVLKVSSNLVGELTQLNSHVNRLTVVNEKMAAMQNELGEGRKLLSEIEADRNEMKTKLSILERMIQEEEQYLDDVSCESGYDEGETTHHPEY